MPWLPWMEVAGQFTTHLGGEISRAPDYAQLSSMGRAPASVPARFPSLYVRPRPGSTHGNRLAPGMAPEFHRPR